MSDTTENQPVTWCCPECGGTNVDEKVWVNVNTRQESCAVEDGYYCNDCDENIKRLLTREQFLAAAEKQAQDLAAAQPGTNIATTLFYYRCDSLLRQRYGIEMDDTGYSEDDMLQFEDYTAQEFVDFVGQKKDLTPIKEWDQII